MVNPTDTELQELKTLIIDLSQNVNHIKTELAEVKTTVNKIDNRLTKVEEKVIEINTILAVTNSKVESNEKNLTNLNNNIGDIRQTFGELKNWRQIAVIIITAIISVSFGWIVRGGKF